MARFSKDPDTRSELVTFECEDGVRLHGGLFTNTRVPAHDLGVIVLHGSGTNFYMHVPGFLGASLPSYGYTTFSMNFRSHDRLYATSIFEDCEKDLRAGVRFMHEEGFEKIVLVGHSLSVTLVLYYMARTQDPSVVGLVLSGGHDDLRGITPRLWEGLVENPQEKYAEVLEECRRLVAEGKGDQVFVIPAYAPDPALKLPTQWRETSAKSFLSYRAPESNNNASKWIPHVATPMLFIANTVVDTTGSPEMSRRLRALATRAPFTEYVEIEGSGHFFVGFEDQVTRLIAEWLDKLRSSITHPVASG
jgi:pimeloyl-ACP methyl ester carboxylesterase